VLYKNGELLSFSIEGGEVGSRRSDDSNELQPAGWGEKMGKLHKNKDCRQYKIMQAFFKKFDSFLRAQNVFMGWNCALALS